MWLIERYSELFGLLINKRKIRTGLWAEIKAHEEAKCHNLQSLSHFEQQQALISLDNRLKAWEDLLECGGLGEREYDLSKTINPNTMRKEDARLTSLILHLYSMDTFLVDKMMQISNN